MKWNSFTLSLLLTGEIAGMLALTGCTIPHTRRYQPVGAQEKAEFKLAVLDVYPDDVRTNLAAYSSTVVAWPGIICDSKVTNAGDCYAITSTLEHHYYDWLEDFSYQRERIFLARRGEGPFKVKWTRVKREPDATLDEVKQAAGPGNLAIVYGVPNKIEGDTVVLEFRCVRLIDPQWYTTNVFNYGRMNEPLTSLGK